MSPNHPGFVSLVSVNVAQHPGKATTALSLCYNAGSGVASWGIWQQMTSVDTPTVKASGILGSATGLTQSGRSQTE